MTYDPVWYRLTGTGPRSYGEWKSQSYAGAQREQRDRNEPRKDRQ